VVAGGSPAVFRCLTIEGRDKYRGLTIASCMSGGPSSNTRQNHNRKRILTIMDKKEIESPKLTARFLIWITGFMIVLFALIAHFVWRIF
jgi:hypothetical protein